MKTLFFLTFVSLGLLTSNAKADDICQTAMVNHLHKIEESENEIMRLHKKAGEITPYEITELQKNIFSRYDSLKKYLNLYAGKDAVCAPAFIGTAIAIYDNSKIGKSVFDHKAVRRIVTGFTKHTPYGLTNFINDYQKYTNNELIESTLYQVASSDITLPSEIAFKTSKLDYDPNLYALSDKAINGTASVVAGAAIVWGFLSDHMKWRQGRLKDNNEVKEYLLSQLKPLDIIYETRKFTLSNLTIPGHWGHTAVWLGTKDELIELGIWDQDYFASFRKHVEAGRNIVEVRKEGLGFQSINTFINLDEIAITRIDNILDRADYVFSELIKQSGKKYDFKFNSKTADRITCTEFISFSYGDIKWKETKTLFQYNLRPDDLAILTLQENSESSFVTYIKGSENGSYEILDFKDWKKILKIKKELTPEEKAERERKWEEERLWREMYGGA